MDKIDRDQTTFVKINFFYENKFPIFIAVGFFLMMSYLAFFHHPIWTETDGIYYLNFGKAILEGNGKDVIIVNGQVGAPILFASLDSIFPDIFSIVKVISILSGGGIVLLSFFITKNIFNYKIAILTQLFIAFNPILHYVSTQALNELFPVFLIFCSLYFITKKELKFSDYFIIGILLGFTSLFRLQGVFVLFPIIVFILIQNKKILKNILNVFVVIIFFSIVFSPQILYNYSTHEVFLDTMPNYYIGNLYAFQTPEWHETVLSKDYTSLYSIITLDSSLFFKNYLYNLFVHNFDRLFNFGFGSFDNISIIPAIPVLGLLLFLGGLGYILYNKKILPKNFLPLLLIPMIYFPIISIIPVYRSYHLFPMWLPLIIICVLFIVCVLSRGSFIQNHLKKNLKLNIFSICIIIIILSLNSGVSYKLVDSSFYGNQFTTLENEFQTFFKSRTIQNQSSYDVILISEILKNQPKIEESYIMANIPSYSFYSNSNFIYAEFSEGLSTDSISDYISRQNWSDFELLTSNIHSFPPDRFNQYHPSPDYLIYHPFLSHLDTTWYDKGVSNKKLNILSDPTNPGIPDTFEFLYKSDNDKTVVYKINKFEN